MRTFIGYGRFTREAMRGLLHMFEDRTEPVSSSSSLWGRPISWHMTPGCEFDWMLLAVAPNEGVVATAGLVATGGRAQDTKVSRARTPRRNCEDLRTHRSWRVSRKRLG